MDEVAPPTFVSKRLQLIATYKRNYAICRNEKYCKTKPPKTIAMLESA